MSSFADLLDILYEDNHLIGLNKPCGWPTTHFDGSEETVDRLVKSYLKEKHNKPGNVYLGVVHRLDKPVSGALVFARTSKAAARLSEQFRDGAVEKVYWAVVEQGEKPTARGPWASSDNGSLDDWLLHDDESHRVRVVPADTPGAKPARLLFQVRGRHKGLTWLELRPHTGRKHQLRVQLAERGCPIYGDRKYGSTHPLGDAIALHARSLTFLHPTTHEPVTLKAEVPKHWRGRFAKLMQGTPR
jgi:23S rRNA pseudouridine1911/1915/1917 synthase